MTRLRALGRARTGDRGTISDISVIAATRAITSSPVAVSAIAKANMPRNRRSAAGPQCRHASRTTSVSELVKKDAPFFTSSARSSR